MPAAALKDVRKWAAQLGAIVEYGRIGDTVECTVEAPPGMIWAADGLHQFVSNCFHPWKPDFDDLLSRMAPGVEPCPDAECEWCHPEEDESQ